EIAQDAKRSWALLFNRRVPLILKLVLPLGALVYWFIPVDLIPMLPIDDIAILLLAMRLFVTLGDQAVGRSGLGPDFDGPVVDGKVVDGKVVDGKVANGKVSEGTVGADGATVDTTWHVVDESKAAPN
ncbi:MAG: hypothetical protein ACRC1H_16070, partial [Caldilineaceae bacterium]